MLAVAGARMPRSCRRLHAPLPLLLLLLLFPLCCLPAETEAERLSPYFGTKSRYEEVNRHLLHDPLSLGPTSPPEQQQQQQQPGSCAPLQLSAVVRHGTRFPTRKQIQKLALLHRQVGGGGGGSAEHRPPPCPAAQSLASWAMWYEAALDGRLAPRGHHDMDTLAQRLTARFPELLLGPQRRFAFVSSSKHRCVDSCAAFREGLSQGTSERPEPAKNESMAEKCEINDRLMRFFEHCAKFRKYVEDNDTAMHEVDAFKESPEMKKIVEKIANTLCLPLNELNADLIQVAFFTCSFELAIKNISSPWCSIFSEDDAKVLEYLNDLKQYWKRAYGYDINSRSSCVLFQDIFKHLDQAVEENKSSRPISKPVIFQFGHAETLQPLLALMGYFRDEEPLMAHNYQKHLHRQFRSGRIVPYASNLIIVLYHCDEAESPEEKYKVQILLNEKPLPFPHSGEMVSLYANLKDHFQDLLQNCHFDEVCDIPQNTTITDEL